MAAVIKTSAGTNIRGTDSRGEGHTQLATSATRHHTLILLCTRKSLLKLNSIFGRLCHRARGTLNWFNLPARRPTAP